MLQDEGLRERVASSEELQRAVAALPPAAYLRLRNFARFRMRAFGGAIQGKAAEDLLGEALTVTLAEQRRWRPSVVDLVTHLCGVMRSISSHWAEQRHRDLATQELTPETTSSAAPPATPETAMIAGQRLKAIESRFVDDPPVITLMEAYALGLTGPEIKAKTGWTQTEMETVVRRLRRGVDKLEADAKHEQ